ncbi:MAG: hypothetical protein F6K39_47945 [Okeania sp. SIO3B3]|nr:hypothetical protein [Okeania sp. SIO3B3]
MNTELLAKLRKRIEAKNGMAVTDQVWQLAHDYHRSHHQAHSLWGHGPGVVSGLHVSAQPDPNEPRQVWIKPGLAIDPEGNTVALHEEINFFVGADKVGPLYFVLKGRTDFPQARGNDVGKAPRYVEENYSINVADELTDDVIELARVNLSKRDSMITDAKNPHRPGIDEIDLRFRRMAGVTTKPAVSVAICHLGEPSNETLPLYGDAVVHLGRAFSQALGYPVFIDEMTSLQDAMHRYSLLVFVEHNEARLSEDEI